MTKIRNKKKLKSKGRNQKTINAKDKKIAIKRMMIKLDKKKFYEIKHRWMKLKQKKFKKP
jgi:hypothetical protein